MKIRPLSVSKGLWLISSVLLVFAGFLSIVSPAALLPVLMLVFGLIMLIAGLFDVAIFLMTREQGLGGSWLLADGILTVILAIYVLCNQTEISLVMVAVFGMWIIFSGVLRFLSSLDLFRTGAKSWWWLTLLAVGCVVWGFIFLFFPETAQSMVGALPGDSLYCTRACAVVFLVVDSAPEEGRAKLNGDGYRFYPVKRAVR